MSVGSQLKQVRTERKLSLADVTKETKIQPWVLEALEDDRLQELMSPIYVKGFMATYSKFLGMDPEALVALLPIPQPKPETEPLPPPAKSVPIVLQFAINLARFMFNFLIPSRRFGSALALTAIVALFFMVKPLHHIPRASVSKTSSPRIASVTQLDNPSSLPEPPPITLAPAQPLQLSVHAQSTTWIQIKADGKLITEQRLPRGADERWNAKKRFDVIVAKPSKVEITLNGQSISPFAIAHRGRLMITHHGITELPDDIQTEARKQR